MAQGRSTAGCLLKKAQHRILFIMAKLVLALACLACGSHARRVQTAHEYSGARDWEMENIARHRAGDMNDAELGMANLQKAMSDSSLLSEVAQGLRDPQVLAELVEIMANDKFQDQAKRVAEQMKANGAFPDFLKSEYYASTSAARPSSQVPMRHAGARMETLSDLQSLAVEQNPVVGYFDPLKLAECRRLGGVLRFVA